MTDQQNLFTVCRCHRAPPVAVCALLTVCCSPVPQAVCAISFESGPHPGGCRHVLFGLHSIWCGSRRVGALVRFTVARRVNRVHVRIREKSAILMRAHLRSGLELYGRVWPSRVSQRGRKRMVYTIWHEDAVLRCPFFPASPLALPCPAGPAECGGTSVSLSVTHVTQHESHAGVNIFI